MTEENVRPLFGAAETTDAGLDWRAEPRSEMLERVITAVDGARGEAQEVGDERYVRYCERVLFPFLEAELEEAKKL